MNNEFNYIHYKYDIAISLTITNFIIKVTYEINLNIKLLDRSKRVQLRLSSFCLYTNRRFVDVSAYCACAL